MIDCIQVQIQTHAPHTHRSPLQEIFYFHQAIRSALHSFAAEVRALRGAEGRVSAAQLAALAERHRFIRAVCQFHSSSEDEIVFPALERARAAAAAAAGAQQQVAEVTEPEVAVAEGAAAAAAAGGAGRHVCEDDHREESGKLEELGRLLGEVKAHARCVRGCAVAPRIW